MYCDPGDPCWPEDQAWNDLGEELGAGVLKTIGPVSEVYRQCSEAITAYGGVTANQIANGTCIFAGACVYKDCKVGGEPNLPVYSVEATRLEHIQATINFARKHRIRVAVKSTGASYAVADQEPHSILIWMSNFPKRSTGGVIENFHSCGTNHGPALNVGGGETWGDVFNALIADGRYMASSGAAVTVGGSGGWLQGGGLGPFDRSLGLGVDNVVEYELVLADGSLKKVNACSEPDLFWALRGGGGGNWGVVVAQTSKVHPNRPLVRANIVWMGAAAIQASIPKGLPTGYRLCTPLPNSIGSSDTVCWNTTIPAPSTLSHWHEVLLGLLNPATMDKRLDGYYGLGCAWGGGFMCADLYFQGTMAEFEDAFLAPLRKAFGMVDKQGNAASGADFVYIAKEYKSYYDYAGTDCANAQPGTPQYYICNTVGYPSANGYNADAQVSQGGYESRVSWMLPTSLFADKARAKEFFSTPPMQYATGHVLGGAVLDPDPKTTSVHPHMRSTAMEILLNKEFDPSSPSMANIRAILDKYVPPPHGSPILNHDARNLEVLTPLGETHGMDWQQLYWGENLDRLQKIKADVDPNGVFTCRNCVQARPK